jgi:hypothetical protein
MNLNNSPQQQHPHLKNRSQLIMAGSSRARRIQRGDRRYKQQANSKSTASRLAPPEAQREDETDTISEFRRKIDGIMELSIRDIKELVLEGHRPENVGEQYELLRQAMKRLLDSKEPKRQQICALRRLIYQRGDTLLVARTGFGKSIIFQSYSVLTGRITIQIIPLSKLGEERRDAINKFTDAREALVTAETKEKTPGLLAEIRDG